MVYQGAIVEEVVLELGFEEGNHFRRLRRGAGFTVFKDKLGERW